MLFRSGTVWACGYNSNGQLGDGTTTDSWIPIQMNLITGVNSVEGGGVHSLILKNDGTVWACGRNVVGQLGNGTTIDSSIPVQVVNLCSILTSVLNTFSFSEGSFVAPTLNNGKFSITFQPYSKEKYVGIYNSIGKKIIEQKTVSEKTEIDLSSQPNGIYFVTVLDEGNNLVVRKIVKM